MNVNFKKIFGIATIIGTAIVGVAGVGKEVTKFKEENPKDDPELDGHTPTPEEAEELAAECSKYGNEEDTINESINESIEEEEED